ncbi:LexA family protein [Effusibacillus lacus]|uniref:Transcriptional regulator n=1 Tax=Effusibacillus lacus TaxID=1348429 RepID=A0A292YJW0_9BACL|nr:LexA family transcriptional regulator [Effusibacillus lacus]TCS74310.1 SOS-response transcriptional repressor LexA [Effusibacillus lacus]GAX88770.1 transcriptional regulator [Effusibacillus lacus]
MNELGNLLRKLRGQRSLREMAELAEVSHTYYADLEKGIRRGTGEPIKPSPETLKRISKATGHPYEDLMRAAGYLPTGYESHVTENKSRYVTAKLIRIPVLGFIKAGNELYEKQQVVGYRLVAKEEIPDGEYFYLIVNDDSMIDEGIKEGSRVLVRLQDSVDEGKIGVVLADGDRAKLKRIFYQGDNVILQSSNRKIPPLLLPKEAVQFQGQVTKVEFDV